MIAIPARQGGKTLTMNKMRDEYIKRNPRAIIITIRNGEFIVEKPVEQIKPKMITKLEQS